MDGAFEIGSEGELFAQAEVIVVGADQNVLIGFARQIRGDVVDGFYRGYLILFWFWLSSFPDRRGLITSSFNWTLFES